jgi:hypothetical protein
MCVCLCVRIKIQAKLFEVLRSCLRASTGPWTLDPGPRTQLLDFSVFHTGCQVDYTPVLESYHDRLSLFA